MKVKISGEKETFKPIELVITIENQSEFDWFKGLFNVKKADLIEINGEFASYTDPDPSGILVDMLNDVN
jgi:hypothetical protein